MNRERCSSLMMLVLALACWGCGKGGEEEKKPAKKPAAATAASTAKAAKAEDEARVAEQWASLLGMKIKDRKGGHVSASTLGDAVRQYSSYEKCRESVEESLPPDLSADLLGHLDLPDGLCRTREALARGLPSACRRIVSYSLRKGCQVMYAIYKEKPDQCPGATLSRKGRDGYCLALASRDSGICLASRTEDQEVRCRAILGRDENICGNLTRHASRERCKADVRRWKPEIDGVQSSLPASYRPSLTLKLRMSGSKRILPYESVDSSCADFGALVPESGNSAPVQLCDYYSYSYRRRKVLGSYRPSSRAKIRLAFLPPAAPTGAVSFGDDTRLSIKISRFGEFSTATTGEIKFSKFERRRGGRIAGTFKARLRAIGDTLEVEGTFDTFVRDLVDPAKMRRKRYPYNRYPNRGKYGLGSITSRPKYGGLLGSLGGSARKDRPVEAVSKRFPALYSAASLTQVKVKGRDGLQLDSILQKSLWDKLGLKNGDVLHKVGSVQMTTRSEVKKIRGELRTAKRLRILLRRNNKQKSLQIPAKTLLHIREEFAL